MLLYLFAATNGTPGGNGGPGNFMPTLLLIGLLGAVFYFLIIRPQAKQRREHRAMAESLRRGDHVVTIGGIYGRVEGVKDKVIVLKVAENVKIEVTKVSIAQVVKRKDEEEEGGS